MQGRCGNGSIETHDGLHQWRSAEVDWTAIEVLGLDSGLAINIVGFCVEIFAKF